MNSKNDFTFKKFTELSLFWISLAMKHLHINYGISLVWLMEILETFPQAFWFEKSQIKEIGGKQLQNSPKKSFSGLQRDSNPVASAFVLQCSTSLSYEDPYTGGWRIYWVYQPVKGMKHRMKWYELREYRWNESVTVAVNRNLSNCEIGRLTAWFKESPKLKNVRTTWCYCLLEYMIVGLVKT